MQFVQSDSHRNVPVVELVAAISNSSLSVLLLDDHLLRAGFAGEARPARTVERIDAAPARPPVSAGVAATNLKCFSKSSCLLFVIRPLTYTMPR